MNVYAGRLKTNFNQRDDSVGYRAGGNVSVYTSPSCLWAFIVIAAVMLVIAMSPVLALVLLIFFLLMPIWMPAARTYMR